MNDQITKTLTDEMERDLGVKLPPSIKPPNVATTRQQIDAVITEMQMVIRILEEAKRRL